MKLRPRIKMELSFLDKFIEVISWMLLVAIWCILLINFSSLPDLVPTHFNFTGRPDATGAKWSLFILPGVATILFACISWINKFPHRFNYPVVITPENAFRQYSNANLMFRYMKLILLVIFGMITVKSMMISTGLANGLGILFLPMTLGFVLGPLAYFIFKAFKEK